MSFTLVHCWVPSGVLGWLIWTDSRSLRTVVTPNYSALNDFNYFHHLKLTLNSWIKPWLESLLVKVVKPVQEAFCPYPQIRWKIQYDAWYGVLLPVHKLTQWRNLQRSDTNCLLNINCSAEKGAFWLICDLIGMSRWSWSCVTLTTSLHFPRSFSLTTSAPDRGPDYQTCLSVNPLGEPWRLVQDSFQLRFTLLILPQNRADVLLT